MLHNIRVNQFVFGKTLDIICNGLLYFTKDEPLNYSLQDIKDACKSAFKRQWTYVVDTGKRPQDHPFLKEIMEKTGVALPGDCFSCLYSNIAKKHSGYDGNPCLLCVTPAFKCDSEFGLYRRYMNTRDADTKRRLSIVIRNTWN